MKNINKITRMIICSAILASPLAPPKVFAADITFTDIDGSYAKDAILELAEKGILNGNGDGEFNPTGHITRKEFAKILALTKNLDMSNPPVQPTFTDIPINDWSYKFIEAAAKAKVIFGLGDGSFNGSSQLSRQDMATIFVRALGVDATGYGEKLTFSDASKISTYAKDAVAYAVELGLLKGYGNNTFNPKGMVERQAAAMVASNFIVKMEELKPEPPPTPKPELKPEPPPVPNPPTPIQEPDRIPPILSNVTNTFVTLGDNVVATSNESGFLYLVPKGTTKSLTALNEAVNATNGVKVTTMRRQPTNLSTDGLVEGTYVVFAVDSSNNISTVSTDIVIITVAKAAAIQRLNAAINYEGLNGEVDYTEETWSVYAEKLLAAKAINTETATTEEINIAAQELEVAIAGLITKVQAARTAAINRLTTAITSEGVTVEGDYTVATWQVYAGKLQAAHDINTETATTEEINAAALALEEAIVGLEKIITKLLSKAITNFNYETTYPTQARQESNIIPTLKFSTAPKQFTIYDGTHLININLNWDLPADIGFTKGQMVGSAVDSFIQDYFNSKNIPLGNRTMSAVGFGDTFFISTFNTGSNASITLGGDDWSYFFQNSSFTGTDEDSSKNKSFTVSDGVNTANILLNRSYRDMADLVAGINNALNRASVSAQAVKVDEDQFEIIKTSAEKALTIGGDDKEEFFHDFQID